MPETKKVTVRVDKDWYERLKEAFLDPNGISVSAYFSAATRVWTRLVETDDPAYQAFRDEMIQLARSIDQERRQRGS